MNKQNPLSPKPKIGTFIDPLTDFGFKFLLGSEPTKELLIDFLNELFKGKKVITDLTYNKNERSGPVPESRKMIFDLTCTGQDGELFIIEVQRIRQQYFKDRAVYYCSRLIHDQAPKGKDWDYLPTVRQVRSKKFTLLESWILFWKIQPLRNVFIMCV